MKIQLCLLLQYNFNFIFFCSITSTSLATLQQEPSYQPPQAGSQLPYVPPPMQQQLLQHLHSRKGRLVAKREREEYSAQQQVIKTAWRQSYGEHLMKIVLHMMIGLVCITHHVPPSAQRQLLARVHSWKGRLVAKLERSAVLSSR